MKLDFILYTHTDYSDIWPLFFGQTHKFFPDVERVVFVDKDDERIPEGWRKIFYNDKLVYRERVLSCLKKMNSNYVIFQHEDMFLYDEPDYGRLIKYLEKIRKTDMNFVKLIRGGVQTGKSDTEHPELKVIDSSFDYIFAIQPTIWKFEKFKEVLEYSRGNTIWEFELDAQRVCRERNIYGYYVDDGGIKRGKYHWDTNVYPYIATAIVKGKWNHEYTKELTDLTNKYNIDTTKRGWT